MQILRNGYETTTIITPPRGRVEWSTEDASVGLTWSSIWKLEQWISPLNENYPHLQSKNNSSAVNCFSESWRFAFPSESLLLNSLKIVSRGTRIEHTFTLSQDWAKNTFILTQAQLPVFLFSPMIIITVLVLLIVNCLTCFYFVLYFSLDTFI